MIREQGSNLRVRFSPDGDSSLLIPCNDEPSAKKFCGDLSCNDSKTTIDEMRVIKCCECEAETFAVGHFQFSFLYLFACFGQFCIPTRYMHCTDVKPTSRTSRVYGKSRVGSNPADVVFERIPRRSDRVVKVVHSNMLGISFCSFFLHSCFGSLWRCTRILYTLAFFCLIFFHSCL